jgi:hypothetical protein
MYSGFRMEATNQLLMGTKSQEAPSLPGSLGTVGQSLTQKLVSKNNAARLFEIGIGKEIGIREEIDKL